MGYLVRSNNHLNYAWLRVDSAEGLTTFYKWMVFHKHGTVFATREQANAAAEAAGMEWEKANYPLTFAYGIIPAERMENRPYGDPGMP